MAILDIFKKKKPKEIEKSEKREEPKEKVELPGTRERAEKRREIKVAPGILKSAHITEKATDLAAKNQYVFKISQGVGKQEIKKAVEGIYGVEVVKVRTIEVSKKRRRLMRTFGWRKGYKKAIVTVREDQKIEILPR